MPALTRESWLIEFADALIALRPHTSRKVVRAVATQEHPGGSDQDPKVVARQWHERNAPAGAKKGGR